MNKSERLSNFELLRIVAMFMIILHHLSLHTDWTGSFGESISSGYLWVRFILMGGKIGVNLFAIMTGYFLAVKDKYTLERVLKIWGTLLFYSLLCFAIGLMWNTISFSTFEFIKCFLPIITVKWWYATTYFLIFLFYPYFNKIVENLGKRSYESMLIMMIVVWSVIPTLTNYTLEVGHFTWFMFLYFLGAYFRKYGVLEGMSDKSVVVLLFASLAFEFIIATVFSYFNLSQRIFGVLNSNYFYEMNHSTTLVTSILMFTAFCRIKLKYYRIINIIAANTFGIYLMHDNHYIQPYLWNTIIRAYRFEDSNLIYIYCLLAAVAVFCVCTVIEVFRQEVVERTLFRLLKYFVKLDK